MLLSPREVVVVVHLADCVGPEDLEHLRDDDVAPRVGVLARELHRRDVGLAELGAGLEEHRWSVHLTVDGAAVEGETLREREEAGGGLVAEATRAEVHADPDRAVFVLHHVHVVVARADGTELRVRGLRQPALWRELGVLDPVDHRVIRPLRRGHAHAERDPPGDLAHDALDAAERVDVCASQLGPRRLVAAADVVAHARRRDIALVGDRAADRLAVADVMVRTENAEVCVACRHASLELREAPRVDLAERLDRAHLNLLS